MINVSINDLETQTTQIQSIEHHQIWIGPSANVVLLFKTDAELLNWVTDLYSKTLTAMPDEVITEICTCGHSRQEHVCEPMVCLTCPVGSKCVGFKTD